MYRKVIILLLALSLLASCKLTQKLWHPYYEERVGQFMISQDGQYVAFLGKKYHYIFSDNGNIIKRLVFSPYHFLMSIASTETYIKLSQSNDLEANIIIKLNVGGLDPAAQREFANLGFSYDAKHELVLQIRLSGKRYFSDRDLSVEANHLNRQYFIKVYEDITTSGKVRKAVLTPITLTIDATLLIGKILLVPFSGN